MRTTAILLLLSSAAVLLTLLAACDPDSEVPHVCDRDGESHREALVFAANWTPSEHDPLADHRPDPTICPASAWGEEFGSLEVRTGECNYLSVEQPLASPIAVGDVLRVQVWWQSLIAIEPATAHLALLIDGELVWETEVEIPGASDAQSILVVSPIAAEADAVVTFHLHNHGANTWTLAEFARVGNTSTSERCSNSEP